MSDRVPERAPGTGVASQLPGPGRAAARDALHAALRGARLGARDRHFLARLVHWDKRSAASVASLLRRARLAGRDEAALTARQLEVVLAALDDSAAYRGSGVAAAACWDCQNMPGGRCAGHSRDGDRARACAELSALLSGGGVAAALLPDGGVAAALLPGGGAGAALRSGGGVPAALRSGGGVPAALLPGGGAGAARLRPAGLRQRPAEMLQRPAQLTGYRCRTPVAS